MRAVSSIESFIEKETGNKFMLDDRLGYIHSCPTNLGTGMRASVHISLPGWAKKGLFYGGLQNRCANLNLQCREMNQDEYGPDYENVYDISNKNRLGFSEVEIIQDMINGINTLYKEDLELQSTNDSKEE